MKKVLIIGGGFSGSLIAKKLERNFRVVLIDTKDYFEFTPGILRTIVEPEHLLKIQSLHKDYLRKTEILIGCVKEVSSDYVNVNDKKINFDYLIISSGSRYSVPIKEQDVAITLRTKHLKESSKKLKESREILIIGGGLVGIELAAEIATHYKDKKITIIHSHNRLIPRNNEKTAKYAEKFLRKKKVDLIFGERVENFGKKEYTLSNGKKIKADIVFLATGIEPNFEFMKKNFSDVLNEENYIIVNEYMQVKGNKNIFAVGDVNDCAVEKTAQNAERQAKLIAHNLQALERENKLKKYSPKKTSLVISLGKYNGIFERGNFVFYGLIPAFMKWFIEKWVMMKH